MNRPIAVMAGLVLLVALGGCSTGDGNSASTAPGAGSGPSDSNSESIENDETEEAPVLDHGAALAAGIAGETAIKCRYIYDEQEYEQLKMIAMGGEVSPEATIYLSGSTVYWDIPESGDTMSHLLLHEGTIYTWKIPNDGLGAKVAQEDHDAARGMYTARMEKNTSDCASYSGPESIFDVPNDMTFEFFPGS